MIAVADRVSSDRELSPRQQRLIENNMKLAFRMAADSDVPLDADERESAALYGLCLAARSYDPARGNRFSTHAAYWIRHELNRSAEIESSTVRIPSYLHHDSSARKNASLGCRAAADRARRRASLRHDIARPASDSPAAIVEAADEQAHLLAAIDRLSAPQREAILDRLAGLNLVESAALRGVTSEAIRMRIERGVTHLRAELAGGAA